MNYEYNLLNCSLYGGPSPAGKDEDFETLTRIMGMRIEDAAKEGWEPVTVTFADLRHAVMIVRRPRK